MQNKKKWMIIGGAAALVIIAVVLFLVISAGKNDLTLGLKKGMTSGQVAEQLKKKGLKELSEGSSGSVTNYSRSKVYGNEASVLSVNVPEGSDWIGLSYQFSTKDYAPNWMNDAAAAQMTLYDSGKELADAFEKIKQEMQKELGEPTDSASGDGMYAAGWEKNGNIYFLEKYNDDFFIVLVEIGIDKLDNVKR